MSLWDSYKTSIFLCHQALQTSVDFAIISAHNPAGHVKHPHLNLVRDKQLQGQLNKLRFPSRSVIGSSPDLSFQEKSWIVLCDKKSAVNLARQFEQNAIFWVEKGELFLVPVLMNQEEECLGLFQERLVILPY